MSPDKESSTAILGAAAGAGWAFASSARTINSPRITRPNEMRTGDISDRRPDRQARRTHLREERTEDAGESRQDGRSAQSAVSRGWTREADRDRSPTDARSTR